jgi:hypothetical protein
MRSYLVMGFFALFVMIVSLVRCVGDREFFRLTAMKRIWGRKRGLTMYFLANVALPLVIGIVFLGQGIVAPRYPGPGNSPLSLSGPHPTTVQRAAGESDGLPVEGFAARKAGADPLNPFTLCLRIP